MKKYIKLFGTFLLILIISSASVFAIENSKNIKIFYRNINIKLNNKNIKLDEEPFIFNNRVYVPLRFISESFGFKILWDENENTVSISTFEDFAEVNPFDGERFVYGEILNIDRKNRKISIYQHIDDNSIFEEPNLKISENVIIILQRNNKKMNLDFKDLKIGDNVGIIIDRNNEARGIIIND